MTRANQHQALEVFSRDYTREPHNLLATDLERFPAFVFQQLYNRLQWHIAESESAERITNEAARRCVPGRPTPARHWPRRAHAGGRRRRRRRRPLCHELDRDRSFKMNSEALAPAVHAFYRDLCHGEGWSVPYDMDYADLPDDVKADNIAAAARIPRVLALVGLAVVSEERPSTLPRAKVLSIMEANMELLAECEHDGWREQKERDGWSYSPVRDDAARQHPCLVRYATLSDEEKEKDRNAVRRYPDIVELAGCKIVEAGGPVRADTR